MATEKVAKSRNIFECKLCDYKSCNKYDYEKHLNTIKHKTNILATKSPILATNLSQKTQDHNFLCYNCNKHYKDKTGLWRHSKKCNSQNNNITNNVKIYVNYIMAKTTTKNSIISKKHKVCLLTGKRSGVLKGFSFSRYKIKNLILNNKYTNIKKHNF